MNNFRNSFGKFVYPSSTLANPNETYGHDEKKSKSNETKALGALKIFYESKNFSVDEPRCDWNFNNSRRRSSRLRTPVEGKKRGKYEKRNKHEACEENRKKPCLLTTLESQVSKTKAKGTILRVRQKPETKDIQSAVQKLDWLKRRDILDKNPIKIEPERVPLNNLFAQPNQRGEVDKKGERSEAPSRHRVLQFPVNKSVSRKISEKIVNPSMEMKAAISDSGKRRINEILKNHAQKIQSTPAKIIQIKDYTIPSVDSQKKISHISSSESAVKDGKDQAAKYTVKNDQNEETKPSTEAQKPKPIEMDDDRASKEKIQKKLPGVWKLPQSNELERRLKNTRHDQRLLLSCSKHSRTEKGMEEERNWVDDDYRCERGMTYTDRLLMLKILGKTLEEKKQRLACENPQLLKTSSKENSESLTKKAENVLACRQTDVKSLVTSIPKEITIASKKKSFNSLKDGRFLETEQVFKTKATRSTELKDMVTQAIKEHKIFCIFDNHMYIVRPVREELLNRGWLEVIPDRRHIPRRRPPPMGPVYERDKALGERNCNTIEAILAAKEVFVDEIQDTVSKSSFKIPIDKPKLMSSTITVGKKSDESLCESPSLFRIIPPTTERKKNNSEIREFVAKYQAYIEKKKDREREIKKLREKEKNSKLNKKDRHRPEQVQNITDQNESSPEEDDAPSLIGIRSFQEIWEAINGNKKMLIQATTDARNWESSAGGKIAIGVLYDSTQKAIEDKKEETTPPKSNSTPPTGTQINVFSEAEAKTISKIIQSSNARIHFMWLSIKPGIHLKCFNYSPEIINKFQKTTFCTKIGLWNHLNNMQWYAHEVTYPAKSPRMYNTGEADDMQAFHQDFQLTACIGMLKWLSDTFYERGLKAVQTKRGKVPLKAFEFAIKQCEKYMRFKENEEINMPEEPNTHQDEWNTFLQWFYIITNDHGKVQESSSAQLMVVYTKAVDTLKAMKRHWPEMDIDGRLNIWIMKPYCASCGRGIFMTNNVYYISQHSKYIVQKYIEKPLLIYNTKFDIRQWFMVTKLTPLEIWMYKECYLRFCSQPFALRNLHESVHLSNNSVQRKYISIRDPNLPDQNMWDSNTFQLYLKTIGYPNAWEEIIYPGMKDAIVSTMLSAQDTFDGPRKSWFEVYGADFMLSSNVMEGPWLIEINENPAMDPSTRVTAKLCPQMLRDVIKVVVDKRANKNASTGQWELIYRQNYSPSFGTVDLDVRGKKIARVPNTKVSLPVAPNKAKVYDLDSVDASKIYELGKAFGTAKKLKKITATSKNETES